MTGKNRIMIYGPKDDGTCVVEFGTPDADVLSISIPRTEAHVIRHFQERMPYGLFVPDESPTPSVRPLAIIGAAQLHKECNFGQ